jgi:hypothetical protein
MTKTITMVCTGRTNKYNGVGEDYVYSVSMDGKVIGEMTQDFRGQDWTLTIGGQDLLQNTYFDTDSLYVPCVGAEDTYELTPLGEKLFLEALTS